MELFNKMPPSDLLAQRLVTSEMMKLNGVDMYLDSYVFRF